MSKAKFVGLLFLLMGAALITCAALLAKSTATMDTKLDTCRSATYNTAKTSADYVVYLLEGSVKTMRGASLANAILVGVAFFLFAISPEVKRDMWFFCVNVVPGGKRAKTEKYIRYLVASASFILSVMLFAYVMCGMFTRSWNALNGFHIAACKVTKGHFDDVNVLAVAVFTLQVIMSGIGHAFVMMRDKEYQYASTRPSVL